MGIRTKSQLLFKQKLIEAVSNMEDIIIDPAAGSFSVMEAAHKFRKKFFGV